MTLGPGFFPDPGSQTHISDSLLTNFLGKKYYNSYCFGKKNSLPVKNKVIRNFMIFVATKNGRTLIFSPSSFDAVVGSSIRDG